MPGEDSESQSPVGDDSQAVAAFSLVKYENPEIIQTEDPVVEEDDGDPCDEFLESILPPREWEHNGRLWRQCVSASPATNMSVEIWEYLGAMREYIRRNGDMSGEMGIFQEKWGYSGSKGNMSGGMGI